MGRRIRTRKAGAGPGVHEAQNKEDKVTCLATLKSSTFPADPCPEPPDGFHCPRRVRRLVHQMKGAAGEAPAQESRDEWASPMPPSDDALARPRWSPKRVVGTYVASLEASSSFGPMVAAEAQERNFYEAPRKAFVADGSVYNWSIHQGYFGTFEPVLDFLHAVCYVFSSAAAVAVAPDEASGWSQYLAWMRACWPGRVGDVLTELDQWQARLGEPLPGEPEAPEDRRDPCRVMAPARTYLGNNRGRMTYPRYRREGLPTTSSLVESLVGEVNARVKSTQKHWTRPAGAESILQLRAAVLSQDDRLPRFFAERPGCPFCKRGTLSHKSENSPAQTAT